MTSEEEETQPITPDTIQQSLKELQNNPVVLSFNQDDEPYDDCDYLQIWYGEKQ